MAYNYGNYYPTPMGNFSPQYSQTPMNQMQMNNMQMQPQMQMQQPQSNNAGFVWVQGEAAAKAYPVAAGNSVLLMDSEAPVLYMKSTDVSGRPLPMETYDLVKRENIVAQQPKQPQIDLSEYVKMSDLESKVKELVNQALNE